MTEIGIYFNIKNSYLLPNKNLSKYSFYVYIQAAKKSTVPHINIKFNNSSGISIMQLPVALLSCITKTTDRHLKSKKKKINK